jgi:hypothetical protein
LFEVQSDGYCGDFSDGLVRISDDGHIGFMDATGEWIIEPRFDYASDFHEGKAVARTDDEWSIIDKNGKKTASFDARLPRNSSFVNLYLSGMFRFVVTGGNAVFLGRNGEIIEIPPEGSGIGLNENLSVSYDTFEVWDLDQTFAIRPWEDWYFNGYPDTLAPFRDNETWEWGFANSKGERVIPRRFEDAGLFVEGLAPVKENGKYGYIDETGEYVIAPSFDDARPFSEGRARVNTGGHWGFIDKEGELVVEAIYSDALEIREGIAPVELDGKWGFVSYRGIMLIDFRFDKVEPFSEGLAAACLDGNWGFINRLGSFVIEPQFDYASRFSDGLAPVAKIKIHEEGKTSGWGARSFWGRNWWKMDDWDKAQTGFIDKTGEMIITSEEFHVTGPFREGRALVSRKGRTNEGVTLDFIDTKGEFVTDYHLTDALDFHNGRAWAVLPSTNAYVDIEGNVIWPVRY